MKSLRYRYDMIGAGPVEHPQRVFRRFAVMHKMEIVHSYCLSIGDCWIFCVQVPDDYVDAYLPCYIEPYEHECLYCKEGK